MEKLAFAMVIVAHKLKPYFQAHIVIVLMDKPLRQVMSSPKVAEQMALWAIELSKFDVQYRPSTAIKAYVIADFVTEFKHIKDQGAREVPQWSIHMDGSSTRKVGGATVILNSLEGEKVECIVRLDFPTTNNKAEYEALIIGLDLAKVAGAENMVVYYDFQVVTS